MPAKDRFHLAVRAALLKDGWTITHDPYRLVSGRRNLWVDLGAEQLLAAEKEARRIAVEVKTFGSPSDLADLEQATGQFVLYRALLRKQEPARELYLAIPQDIWAGVFQEPVGETILEEALHRIVCYDPLKEEIVQWVHPTHGAT